MSSFFDRMLGRNAKETSASQAKQRLQFVLVHDRIDLPPERLAAMKAEILAVISKYVHVSGESVDIALQQRDRNSSLLVAEVPFSKSLSISDPDEDEPDPKAKYQPDAD
ncbi:MAG: cell division topological specificity factor MinE [Armatimonadetes bacterium]|nr:cell division topological specificity factor MinE [Anaerolineae bacterium]